MSVFFSVLGYTAEKKVVTVEISKFFNNDGIAFERNPGDGTFGKGIWKYPGEMFRKKVKFKGIIFKIVIVVTFFIRLMFPMEYCNTSVNGNALARTHFFFNQCSQKYLHDSQTLLMLCN